ncbi:hypothetical protein [Paenibacillus woosongensis]|nr:hypothetical protein [Paenibacillus woosongensis]
MNITKKLSGIVISLIVAFGLLALTVYAVGTFPDKAQQIVPLLK